MTTTPTSTTTSTSTSTSTSPSASSAGSVSVLARVGRLGVGAALAVTAVLVGTRIASGVGDDGRETVFVPVTPCRLLDTRAGAANVGPRSTPLPANVAVTFGVRDGDDAGSVCEIPVAATAVGANVTVVSPSAASFLTVFPSDVDRPNASSLNYRAGQSPTPNAVTIVLSEDDGRFNMVNRFGTVNVIVDINGYYIPANLAGQPGPAGPAGADGSVNRLSNSQIAELRWYEDPGLPATISVGSQPNGIAYDGTNIYVTNFNDGTVSVIDPLSATVIDTIDVGDGPFGIAYTDGVLYVTNRLSNTVSMIDSTSREVEHANVGGWPSWLASQGGRVWVTNTADGTVTVVERGANEAGRPAHTVGDPINVGPSPRGIAFDGTNMYVLNSVPGGGDGKVRVYNAETRDRIAEYDVEDFPASIAYGAGRIFVTNSGDDTVSVIDPATGDVVSIDVGNFPYGMAYDGKHVYVTNSGDGTVSVIDPATNSVVGAPIPVGGSPRGFVFDGTHLYVTNQGDDTVTRFLPR